MVIDLLLGPEYRIAGWTFEVVHGVLVLPQTLLASEDPITIAASPCFGLSKFREMCVEV